jgi:hypothetical protein
MLYRVLANMFLFFTPEKTEKFSFSEVSSWHGIRELRDLQVSCMEALLILKEY